jgi:hypothetical protein
MFGQAAPAADRDQPSAKERVKSAVSDTDTTYGRIKEFTAGQKVVIAIDNAPDKTFDLSDKDLTVKMPRNLKVGDMVKVNEHEVAGKTKSVNITKHSGSGATHRESEAGKKP